MISKARLESMFEKSAIEAIPTDKKRIVVACQGFEGAIPCTYTDWEGNQQTASGLAFTNPKDNATQVLHQENGCLIMYDGPGRQEKVEKYLQENPKAVTTAEGIKDFIDYLQKEVVVSEDGKPDLWDTDIKWVAKNLKNAPALEEIKPGSVIVSVKNQETVEAVRVGPGVEIKGAAADSQVAGQDGAYIIREKGKDDAGNETTSYRMVQKKEFESAYEEINKKEENTAAKKKEIDKALILEAALRKRKRSSL